MGGVVCRRDCGVCGWKDRCRDDNLRRYCHGSPILFVLLFWNPSLHVSAFFRNTFSRTCFRGFFGGKGPFLGFYNTYMSFIFKFL